MPSLVSYRAQQRYHYFIPLFDVVLASLIHCLGDWTQIRNLAQNSKLAAKGFEGGLDKCVILNPGTPAVSKGSMADTMEAILGAVELDGGSEALLQVAMRLGLVHSLIIPVTSKAIPFPCLNKEIYI
jgi:hypothetical protein